MIDLVDRDHEPSIAEIGDFIGNPLFHTLYDTVSREYRALSSVVYSGDNVLLGWNVRLFRGGRTLCRLYPKRGYFSVLVVVGRKEKERVELLLPGMSHDIRRIYDSTQEGMGQRWLIIDLNEEDAVYADVLTLIRIRAESK